MLPQLQLIGVLGWPSFQVVGYYTWLFAASGLTSLSLLHVELDPRFGAAVFAPGVQLPRLLQLQMGWTFGDGLDNMFWSGEHDREELLAADRNMWALKQGDVASLVRCSPNLQQLWLTNMVAPDTDMAALTALTALTELAVGGDVVDDAVAVEVLGHRMQVQGRLGVFFSQTLSLAGWRQLNGMLGVEVQVAGCRANVEYTAEHSALCQLDGVADDEYQEDEKE